MCENSEGEMVSEGLCNPMKRPADEQSCSREPCEKYQWTVGDWSQVRYRQTDRQTNRRTDRQTDRQTDRPYLFPMFSTVQYNLWRRLPNPFSSLSTQHH